MATIKTASFPVKKIIAVIGVIVTANAIIWLVAGLTYAKTVPQGTALLVVAYTLGLRHALDADHIAAIDNVTRRLVQAGQKPVTVGLFFSLGHSSIVIIATILVAALSAKIEEKFNAYNTVSSVIGPSISAGFLFLIGIINGVSAYLIVKDFKHLKSRANDDDFDWDEILANSGFFSRVFGKYLFKVIDAPWKMYFVGFLFGLGFDTATEVALLAIAALQALQGADVWLIQFLPLLFTCGMVLLDTADGIMMLGAYGWASITPSKKLYYNLSITTISSIFAIFIAFLQLFGILQSEFNLNGIFWDFISTATSEGSFGAIGIALLLSFLIGWFLSRVLYQYYYLADNNPVSSETNQQVESEDCSTDKYQPNTSVTDIAVSLQLGDHEAVDMIVEE